MQIRCGNKLFGILTDDGVLEIKCNSVFCGAAPGVVIIHKFSAADGRLLETKQYKDTPVITEGVEHGRPSTPVRSP